MVLEQVKRILGQIGGTDYVQPISAPRREAVAPVAFGSMTANENIALGRSPSGHSGPRNVVGGVVTKDFGYA